MHQAPDKIHMVTVQSRTVDSILYLIAILHQNIIITL